MKQQSARVPFAAEYLETRRRLDRIVDTEDEAVVGGEAEDFAGAPTLARILRPDRALIDSYVPSAQGYDGIFLSPLGESTNDDEEAPPEDGLADKMVFYGALVMTAGWLTILTIAFANMGMFVVFAGAASTLLGLAAKLVSKGFKRPVSEHSNRA